MQQGATEVQGAWRPARAGTRLEPRGAFTWYRIAPPRLSVPDPALRLSWGRFSDGMRQGDQEIRVTAAPLFVPLDATGAPVVVRVRNRHNQYVPRVYAGSQRALWADALATEVPSAVVGGMLLFVGAALLAVSLRRGGTRSYRGLGLFFLPLGAIMVINLRQLSSMYPLPADAVVLIHHAATSLYPIGFADFVLAVFGDGRHKLLRRGLVVYAVFLGVGWGLHAARLADFSATRDWVALFIIAFALQAIGLAAKRARGGDGSGWAFLFGISILLALGVVDLIPSVSTVQTTPFGIAVFSMAMAVVIERQYAQAREVIERTARDLEGKVAALVQSNREVGALNAELRHQIASRSRDLSQLLQGGRSNVTTGRALAPGDVVAERYEVVRTLGEGGMGAVYEVRRRSDGRALALKMMTNFASATAAARFAREAEIAARVVDEHLVAVLDVGGAQTGELYLVMEIVKGVTLDEAAERYGDVPWALDVLTQVAHGLVALHAAGVVHRDLKPSNVLLSIDSGGSTRAKIADFGIANFEAEQSDDGGAPIAHAIADASSANSPAENATLDAPAQRADASRSIHEMAEAATMIPPSRRESTDAVAGRARSSPLTATGAIVGTPAYMAPEAVRGSRRVRAPADMFAFGLIAYEMLCARAAYDIAPALCVLSGLDVPAPPAMPSTLDERVRALVLDCLSIDPAARPSAARAVEVLTGVAPRA